MKNGQKSDVKNTPAGITRRRLLQCTAVGGLAVLTGAQIAYRKWRQSQNPLGITEITIEGPFENGTFTRETLGQRFTTKTASDFKLLRLSIRSGKYNNSVGIAFAFTGKEDPNRKMEVSFTVYDNEGKVIGGQRNVFGDPRIKAKEWNAAGNRFIMEPVSTLSARLVEGKDYSHISRVEIFAMEINSQ